MLPGDERWKGWLLRASASASQRLCCWGKQGAGMQGVSSHPPVCPLAGALVSREETITNLTTPLACKDIERGTDSTQLSDTDLS